MTAYYNEIDPFAAAWLRELIKANVIAPGVVDETDIRDINPADLSGYTQCHFFAGIGVWSYALRQAGWPDDRLVWTGSCPCQPFSAAGKRAGHADERHLWPHWHHLIEVHRPPVVLGEQVASKDGLGWLDLVQADLEGSGYACGAVDLCAAGVGAPHIRQRLWFVGERLGDTAGDRRQPRRTESDRRSADTRGAFSGVADADCGKRQGGTDVPEWDDCRGEDARRAEDRRDTEQHCGLGRMADACGTGLPKRISNERIQREEERAHQGQAFELCGDDGRRGPTNGIWRDADWLFCRDGKWRPVEPGTFPLAHGAPVRVGRLRGYGNAINAEVARTFIESYMAVGSVEC